MLGYCLPLAVSASPRSGFKELVAGPPTGTLNKLASSFLIHLLVGIWGEAFCFRREYRANLIRPATGGISQ